MNQSINTPTTPETKLNDLADRLLALKDEKEDMERIVRDISAGIEAAEQQLIAEMQGSGTPQFIRAGYTHSLVTKPKASALDGKKKLLYAAMKEKGFGGLLFESINPDTLSNFAAQQMSKNKGQLPKWLGSLVRVYDKTTLSVRKAGK